MKKLQQFYILSLRSDRLKQSNYKIKNLNIDDARKNNELISVGDSQLLRSIRQVRGIEVNKIKLNYLWSNRLKLKKKPNTRENSIAIQSISLELDKILFVPDLISVEFVHVAHYRKVGKSGFTVNGERYVRLMAGAGHLRRSTVLFIREDIRDKIISIFENGMDKSVAVNYGKFGAYLGLYSSSSLVVTTPKFVVVPDLIVKRIRKVDFVEDDNSTVVEKDLEVEHNCFDGQGLVSLEMAEKWSNDLGLDYVGVSFIVRSAFTKGLLVGFPFHRYAKKNNISVIVDVYGKEHDVSNIDVILTESQFKMKANYKSIEDFVINSHKNNLTWGVTRVNPKIEKDSFRSSYQYIQVLNEKVDIDEIVKDTIGYFKDVSLLDANKSLIYMMGESTREEDIRFQSLDNPVVMALSLNKNSINDPYIRNSIIKTLNKKIRESYTGKLLLNGNYQFVIFDPYALTEHAFGRCGMGLLSEGESYSRYWSDKGTSRVVSGRSPLTWRSELNKLDFSNNYRLKEWFGHINSGIVFSIHGEDMMLYGDADGDGDTIFTTDNEQMIEHSCEKGKPVTYNKVSASKEIIDYDKFVATDINSFDSKIGLITNYSTTYYSMQSVFEKGSEEYEEIEKRLMICRRGQGQEIDKTKGIITAKFPEWGKRVAGSDLHNRILANKRPLWMQYLYSHKKVEWEEHWNNYNYYCYGFWGIPLETMLEKDHLSKEQELFLQKFKKHSPLLMDTNGVMDRVSRKMISSIKELKIDAKNRDFDYSIYVDESIPVTDEIKSRLTLLMKVYNKMKKDFYLTGKHEDMGFINDYIRNKAFEISSSLSELTNCSLDICYSEKGSGYEFVWQIFSEGIIENMKKKSKTFIAPVSDKRGSVTLANKSYTMKEIEI